LTSVVHMCDDIQGYQEELRLRSLARQRPKHSAKGVRRRFKAKVTGRRQRLRRLRRRPDDRRSQGEGSYNVVEVMGQRWASRGPTARAQEAKAMQEEKT
jgi:hypothetical protein